MRTMGDGDFREAFEGLLLLSYRVALRILGHPGDSEDVAAEALARTLRSWSRVRRLGSPEAWVTRVTTNLAIDVLRRRRFADKASTLAPLAMVVDDPDVRIALRELLRTLPRRQCEVLALRYLADLSEVEVAAALGISLGSVKRHASRGVTRLRKVLDDAGTGGVSYAW
jgi:RNA polymerase sigma factor (sigma-70 family)